MNVLKILGKSKRMELTELAGLLLRVSVKSKEDTKFNREESGEECEGCGEDDEDECIICGLRNILYEVD